MNKKTPPMWKHQNETLALLKKQPHVLDASDPGTGKTRAHIEGYDHIRKKHGGKCIVICPKTIMGPAWQNDFKKFAPHLTTTLAYAHNREEAFAEDVDVYITNTDATKWLVKQKAKFFKPFSTIIVDEISDFKHRTSARSKALKKIREHFQYRRGLSATLTANTLTDIWHPMFLMDDGERLGKTFSAFRSAVQVPEQNGPMPQHIKWVDKPGMESVVAELIKDVSIRHQFDEVMDIPENRTHYVSFNLPPKLLKIYRKLEADAVVELEKSEVTAVNAAVLRNKLLQVASGAVYSEEGVYEVLASDRYNLITDLVEARKHSVVFFNWTHQRDQLVATAKARKIRHCVIDGKTPQKDRDRLVDAFQSGLYQAIYLHPKTGAHGLTLTKGTSTIWCSPIYQADYLKQGKHRIYRGGQTLPTETILVQANNTVEHLVYERLNEKSEKMMDFLQILKEST